MAKKSDVLSGKKVIDKETVKDTPVKEAPVKEKTAVIVAEAELPATEKPTLDEEVKVSGEGLVEATPENINDIKESEGTGEEMTPVEGEISNEEPTEELAEELAGEIEIEEAANVAPSASYDWKDESGVVVVEPEKEVKKETPVVRQSALDILKERAQRKITTPKTAVDVLNSRKKGYQASNALEELKRRKLLR